MAQKHFGNSLSLNLNQRDSAIHVLTNLNHKVNRRLDYVFYKLRNKGAVKSLVFMLKITVK